MTLLAVEAQKLRTVRSSWVFLAAAQVIVVGGVTGLVVSGGSDLGQAATVRQALSHVGLAALFALVLGVLAVAGEYRHRTITDTYLSTPVRQKALAAKVVVYTGVGLGLGCLSSITALVTVEIWWGVKGVPLDLSASGAWSTLGGDIAWNAVFAAIGVGLGAVIRNVTAAIAVVLAWIALVEVIVGQLIGSSAARWLPFAAAQALGRIGTRSDHLPQWMALLVLIGYAIGLAALAVSVTLRRDVT